MSFTSTSSSDSAILNAQQKTGPKGMVAGIARGDLGRDRAADQFAASFTFYGWGVRRGGKGE